MRSDEEMMNLILNKAKEDERIRAVYMQGSRVVPYATHDKYSDYDIVYLVNNIKSFTKDDGWLDYFGHRLIMQKPADWYGHPYDYCGNEPYNYLMQFKDGNRIDLTLIDLENMKAFYEDEEPLLVLLNKDDLSYLKDRPAEDYYYVKKPSAQEFYNTENEFWWISINSAKGLCREELTFTKFMMERYQIDMLYKILQWRIGVENNFLISTGKCYKYLKRYLSTEDMNKLIQCYPNGYYEDIWDKLLHMCSFFNEVAEEVALKLSYEYDSTKGDEILEYIKTMKNQAKI